MPAMRLATSGLAEAGLPLLAGPPNIAGEPTRGLPVGAWKPREGVIGRMPLPEGSKGWLARTADGGREALRPIMQGTTGKHGSLAA